MDIQYLKGVGEKSAAKLAKLDIYTVNDLLCHFPRDYIDYSAPYPVASAPYDTKCVVRATVYSKAPPVRVRSGKKLYKVSAVDETCNLTITWFNNEYTPAALKPDVEYLFFGKFGGTMACREIISPIVVSAETAQGTPFTPVYPLTEKISSAYISKCVKAALEKAQLIDETLPQKIVEKYRLCSRVEAIKKIHFPKCPQDIANARRRLIFEELLLLQLGLLQMRGRGRQLTGAVMKSVDMLPFWQSLPFEPTSAQKRASEELCADLCQRHPANRLLQGDVGSGKTLVAAAGIYFAFKNGYQSVLMAPTELLAQQHADTMAKLLMPFGINIALLTASIKGAQRKEALKHIANGDVNLVVGTHAVLTDNVIFSRLGFAVTDEQHRFGVRQRTALAQKADHPHILVMSATPIPRTLALIMFGDLDRSVLDEMPKGRKKIKTYVVSEKKRRDMYGFLNQHIASGRQIYIVCPLVEEGETELHAVTGYIDEIARPLLPKARVGLMHGKLKAADKSATMQAFRDGQLDVLVSTTVIEIGVDVPNASIMVIENAERYGLSALHQLRGRVGRGQAEAFCFLVSDHEGESAKQRLSVLCQTQDGFEVAKYDLETRGPGDFFGSRQHGLPTLQIANLATDSRILDTAQNQAQELLQQDPALESAENAQLKSAVERMFSTINVMN